MEYLPSYTDQLYHSYEPSWRDSIDGAELYHYGIKGMKWGVRHYRDSSGKKVKKAGIGTATRVRQKQQMFRDKQKNSKLGEGGIARNVVNTWREGRINELEYKAKHREAKRDYLKSGRSKAAAKKLRTARGKRIFNNLIIPSAVNAVVPGVAPEVMTIARGAYQRHKKSKKR